MGKVLYTEKKKLWHLQMDQSETDSRHLFQNIDLPVSGCVW